MTADRRPPGPGIEGSGEEGFLGRWSRRKATARAGDEAVDIQPGDESAAAGSEASVDPSEFEEPEALDPASLPDLDSLGPDGDFSVFMQAGVPPALKTKALRKLWRVKPELANLDGLLDYGEDLTGSFKVVDHLKTAYEVGRGFLRDDKEVDDRREGPPDEKPESAPPEIEDGAGSGFLSSPGSEGAEPVISDAKDADLPTDDKAAQLAGKKAGSTSNLKTDTEKS